ncbi:MAG: TlpA family protein disulfide reductase [Bacillota bacterium]
MNRKTKSWILFFTAVAVGAVIAWSALGDRGASPAAVDQPSTVADLLGPALSGGKPLVIVLTYNADCCESTKQYFARHREMAEEMEQSYQGRVSFIWLDIALYDKLDRSGLKKLAQDYQIKAIPAIIVLDGNGAVAGRYEGIPDDTVIRETLDKLVNG